MKITKSSVLIGLACGWVFTALMGVNRVLRGESPSIDVLLVEAALYFCTFAIIATIAKDE